MSLFYGQPSVRPNPEFEAEAEAKKLRKAMKGLGTDEKTIISVLSQNNNEQRQEIKKKFKTMFGKDLEKELSSELGGHFEQVCLSLLVPPRTYDALCLHNAIKASNTNEKCLVQTLCTRSNEEIEQIKTAYKKISHQDLEQDLQSETSGHFKRLLISILTGNREQNIEPDQGKVESDAQALVQAGPAQLGTDESSINSIMALRSPIQLLETFDAYATLTGKDLEEMIKEETSGDLRDGYLAIIQMARNPSNYFASQIKDSLAGPGTDDDTLIRLIVSRSEMDLDDIKSSYSLLYSKSMLEDVRDDTGGDYQKILVALIGE